MHPRSPNLCCAEGLPGSEELNVAKRLSTLDRWTEKVRFETERRLYKFAQNPKGFENSEAFYRMMMLVTVPQQDFKAHYNKERSVGRWARPTPVFDAG